MISYARSLYHFVKYNSPFSCIPWLRVNPLPNCRDGRCDCTSFKSKKEPRYKNFSPSTYCLVGGCLMVLSFSRVRMIQSAFCWMNASITACDTRIGARTESVPSRSTISAIVLRLLRVSLSIWICMIIKNPLTRVFVCRGGDLDSRPRAYESPALPLSYLGVLARAPQILLWERAFVNVRP